MGYDWNDPLVNPPGAGMGGWFARCWSAAQRSWRPLVVLILITGALPAIVFGLLSPLYTPASMTGGPTPMAGADPGEAAALLRELLAYEGVVLAAAVVMSLVQAVGWAGGTWILARQAAGHPAAIGAAFRYGLRRAPALWGWYLLCDVIVLAGFCACFLPAVYLGFALSLAGPVYLFERVNPISRSFGMVHARFGMVLGRVATVVGLALAGGVVVVIIQVIGQATGGTGPTGVPAFSPVFVLTTVLVGLLYAPIYLLVLIGLVIT